MLLPLDFDAEQALYGLIALDVLNLIFGFVRLDSAAHLSGAFFGYLYYWYGHALFKRMRVQLKALVTA